MKHFQGINKNIVLKGENCDYLLQVIGCKKTILHELSKGNWIPLTISPHFVGGEENLKTLEHLKYVDISKPGDIFDENQFHKLVKVKGKYNIFTDAYNNYFEMPYTGIPVVREFIADQMKRRNANEREI